MKNLFTLFAIVISAIFMAQAPNLLSYQAVVRNAANQLVINQNVGVKFSILKSSATGAVVYAETQNSTTNSNGLFTTNIGSGTVISGSMASINWANDVYFIKSEIDLAGGSNYTITGTQQLLSVPYALNAKNGIPNGGTANQVLAKVDGTDYNTQWVTPSGGTSLPAQTGNAGKVLTTDGTNPSWTNAPILGTLQVSPVTSGGTTNVTVSNLNVRNIMLDYQGGNGNASGTIINIIVPSAASYPAGTILTFSSTNTITTSPLTVGNYTFTSPNSTITAHVANNVSTANAVTLTNNGASGVLNVITDGVSKWYRIN